MADEVQTFKALITIHKVLQEGHPITVKEAQQNVNWVESLARGVTGEGLRGMRSCPRWWTQSALPGY
jgi:huntingtin-interacting protein 1-related protein